MGKLKKAVSKVPRGTSFTGVNGFDLMHGAPLQNPSSTPRVTDNSKPPLVPGTGMGMGMSGIRDGRSP